MNRKKQRLAAGAVAAMLTTGLFAGQMLAANVQPGSASDPVVTKSYVDNLVNQALGGGVSGSGESADQSDIVSDVMAQIEYLYGDNLRSGSAGSVGSDAYEPVSALAGQIILGREGTEIILRSGSASSYCPGENGLTDVTQGADLTNGKAVLANHLLIIPREDGRGVQVQTDAWFLIKGGYHILTY